MKDGNDSTAVGRAPEPEAFANRKLIRPTLSRPEGGHERRERPAGAAAANAKKSPPPEQTHAENFY